MKNKLNRFYLGVLVLVSAVLSGQVPPPPPPQEETGGIGGKRHVPVDMYVVLLAIVAVMFIIYFVKKYNKKTATL